jgi:hypothetical protein
MPIKTLIVRVSIVLTLFSCEGPTGPAGKMTLTNITDEPAGSNCANGGQKIESGIDEDGNGQLSSVEVSITKFVCNGLNTLIHAVAEQAGAICENGGLKITLGVDTNGNGTLEAAEVDETKYTCHGVNGLSSLTTFADEPEGSNCTDGGFKIQVGQDANRNLTLDAGEITSTRYICVPETDKQVRLAIGESNVSTTSTDWYNTPFQTYRLIKFNKLDFANVDSITFVPSLYTSDAANKVFVQLYNWTDNVVISDSEITSNTPDWIFKESGDLYDKLPNKEVILGIRIKSESSSYFVSTGIVSYLFIYKH